MFSQWLLLHSKTVKISIIKKFKIIKMAKVKEIITRFFNGD
jgi:hypothetical protein